MLRLFILMPIGARVRVLGALHAGRIGSNPCSIVQRTALRGDSSQVQALVQLEVQLPTADMVHAR